MTGDSADSDFDHAEGTHATVDDAGVDLYDALDGQVALVTGARDEPGAIETRPQSILSPVARCCRSPFSFRH